MTTYEIHGSREPKDKELILQIKGTIVEADYLAFKNTSNNLHSIYDIQFPKAW